MLATPAVGEAEDDGLERVERGGAVAPQVGPVRLAVSQVCRLEHRHRRLIGMKHRLAQQLGGQGVDQRLQLHAALTDPLRQRRAGD